jgi:hypothetical protein
VSRSDVVKRDSCPVLRVRGERVQCLPSIATMSEVKREMRQATQHNCMRSTMAEVYLLQRKVITTEYLRLA